MDFCLPEMPETRRQDLKPDAYVRSGSIYAVKRDEEDNSNSDSWSYDDTFGDYGSIIDDYSQWWN